MSASGEGICTFGVVVDFSIRAHGAVTTWALAFAAAFVRACGRDRIAEIRIAADGITLTHIPGIAYEALQEAA